MEHPFTTYVRTKTVFQTRLKDLKTYDTVRVYMYELNKLHVSGELLYSLKVKGEIDYDDHGNFKALLDGSVDIELLERTRKWKRVCVALTDLHVYMRDVLMRVSIDTPLNELPVYFRTFIEQRDKSLDVFFSVDGFSGRVHTPIVNLKGIFRSKLRIDGVLLRSLDVKQIQPTILAAILFDNVGANPFSEAITAGRDIYLLLLEQNRAISTREDAKKFLYKLIFGYPMEDIGSLIKGDTSWVSWINSFKSSHEPRNPHGRDTHTNLAWLLQTKEVEIMTAIWQQLRKAGVAFLSIHDDVLVTEKDKDLTFGIMNRELRRHFKTFQITVL